MAPHGWATKQERDFLTAFIPEYEAHQVKRRYKPLWQRVNAEFLVKFPVIDKFFPGMKVGDLTLEQKEMYTAGVVKQQQRIKEWYRWRFNPRSRHTNRVINQEDLHRKRTRPHRAHEVFAKLLSEEVEEAKARRCEEELGQYLVTAERPNISGARLPGSCMSRHHPRKSRR